MWYHNFLFIFHFLKIRSKLCITKISLVTLLLISILNVYDITNFFENIRWGLHYCCYVLSTVQSKGVYDKDLNLLRSESSKEYSMFRHRKNNDATNQHYLLSLENILNMSSSSILENKCWEFILNYYTKMIQNILSMEKDWKCSLSPEVVWRRADDWRDSTRIECQGEGPYVEMLIRD